MVKKMVVIKGQGPMPEGIKKIIGDAFPEVEGKEPEMDEKEEESTNPEIKAIQDKLEAIESELDALGEKGKLDADDEARLNEIKEAVDGIAPEPEAEEPEDDAEEAPEDHSDEGFINKIKSSLEK